MSKLETYTGFGILAASVLGAAIFSISKTISLVLESYQWVVITLLVLLLLGAGGALVCGLRWLFIHSSLVYPKNGLFPLVITPNGAVYDANRAIQDNPTMAQVTLAMGALEVQRAAAAAGGRLPVTRQLTDHSSTPVVVDNSGLPERVELTTLLPDVITLNSLTLGLGASGPVRTSLAELMHMLTVGASGWGKSVFLRSFLYQLALSQDDLRVVCVDCFGSEFNGLSSWQRLAYPIASTVNDAAAALAGVTEEIERRKMLYKDVPVANDLESYARLSGNKLVPWVVCCDELSATLATSGLGEPLRQIAQTARQYGVYLLGAGQTAKADVLPTQTRDQFSSRIAFHCPPSSSRVVLDSRDAADITTIGRALAILPGRQCEELQAGYVDRDQFLAALVGGGPSEGLPVVEKRETEDDTRARRILELRAQGMSLSKIEREVFGYSGGSAHNEVTKVLQNVTTTAA